MSDQDAIGQDSYGGWFPDDHLVCALGATRCSCASVRAAALDDAERVCRELGVDNSFNAGTACADAIAALAKEEIMHPHSTARGR